MSQTKAILYLILAAIIVGSTVIISKIISVTNTIFSIQFISLIIASITLLLVIGKENISKNISTLTKKDLCYLLLQSFIGMVVFRIMIIYGVQLTTALDAGIILSLVPVTTVVFSIVFLKESLERKTIIAVVLAFLGILIINVSQSSTESIVTKTKVIGNIMIFIAVLSESSFVIFSKKINPTLYPLFRSLMLCLFGIMLLSPLALYELIHNYAVLLSLEFWILAAYTGLILTTLAYVLWFSAIPYVTGSTAAIINSFIPVSSIIMIIIVFKEMPTINQLIGFAMILSALSVMFLKEKTLKKDTSSEVS